jgi:hypothetical protein
VLHTWLAWSAREHSGIKQWRQWKLDRSVRAVGAHVSDGLEHPYGLGELIVRYAMRGALLLEPTQQARHHVESAGCAVILVEREHCFSYDIPDVTAASFSGIRDNYGPESSGSGAWADMGAR